MKNKHIHILKTKKENVLYIDPSTINKNNILIQKIYSNFFNLLSKLKKPIGTIHNFDDAYLSTETINFFILNFFKYKERLQETIFFQH